MDDLWEFVVYLFQLIAPQPCFDEIFVKHNFLNGTDCVLTDMILNLDMQFHGLRPVSRSHPTSKP